MMTMQIWHGLIISISPVRDRDKKASRQHLLQKPRLSGRAFVIGSPLLPILHRATETIKAVSRPEIHVEIPSDLHGVIYTRMDAAAWLEAQVGAKS
jgi:hypothetical protein